MTRLHLPAPLRTVLFPQALWPRNTRRALITAGTLSVLELTRQNAHLTFQPAMWPLIIASTLAIVNMLLIPTRGLTPSGHQDPQDEFTRAEQADAVQKAYWFALTVTAFTVLYLQFAPNLTLNLDRTAVVSGASLAFVTMMRLPQLIIGWNRSDPEQELSSDPEFK